MNKSKMFNLYLGLVSILSIIALAINVGIIFTMLGSYFLINDSEYISSKYNYYTFRECEETYVDKNCKEDKYGNVSCERVLDKTLEEIQKCKKEKEFDLIQERKYDFKIRLITAFSWFMVFIILFGFHYPKFKDTED